MVHVVAKDPAPNFVEFRGNIVLVLLSVEVNGKLQLCLGGLTGAHGAFGFETLARFQAATCSEISLMRFSKKERLKSVVVPAGIDVHLKVAPLSTTSLS